MEGFLILVDKKNGKSLIDKRFEYNTYIRDFFADNKGRILKEAIVGNTKRAYEVIIVMKGQTLLH